MSLITFNSFTQKLNEKSNPDNVSASYHQDIISIANNEIIKGREAMNVFLNQIYREDSLVSYTAEYKIPVGRFLEYEIGCSKTIKSEKYAHLIIWIEENNTKKRITEIIHKMTDTVNIPSELDKVREKWMTLCNDHNSKILIEELYTIDAIYYNRGRVLRGHEQLSNEYGYMNNPSYSLQLNPKHVEVVSNTIIYEIGVCSGSYNLPYMLIWKKKSDGIWKIYFDSNF